MAKCWNTICEGNHALVPPPTSSCAHFDSTLIVKDKGAVIRNVVCASRVSPKEMTSEQLFVFPPFQNMAERRFVSNADSSLCNASVLPFSVLMMLLLQRKKFALIDLELHGKGKLRCRSNACTST